MSDKSEDARETTGAGVSRTEPLPAQEPDPTKSFEVLDETKKLEAEAAAFVADQRAAELSRSTTPEQSNPLDLPTPPAPEPEVEPKPAAQQPPAPTFRPENESPESGFVGYITTKRGPEPPPNQNLTPDPQPGPARQPQFTPPAAAVPSPPPMGHPGIRTSTVIIGLLLLAIGLSALISQLGEITINPAAVVLTVMLGAGVTLMSAAIRRTQRSKN